MTRETELGDFELSEVRKICTGRRKSENSVGDLSYHGTNGTHGTTKTTGTTGICGSSGSDGSETIDGGLSSFTEKNELAAGEGGVEPSIAESGKRIPPPDKGFAWVMAFCTMAISFSTWGVNAGYGVFLSFYMSSNTFPGASEYDFALIGGLALFCAQGLAPIAAILNELMGFHVVCMAGIIIQFLGYMLASFATKIWQLYLTQGVLVGVSFSLCFLPATIVQAQWFEKRLATAMGIAISGAGLGGIFFSLTINKLIQQTGNQKWALRMCGLVTLVTSLTACWIMKYRIPQKKTIRERFSWKEMKESFRVILDINVFKNITLVMIAVWFGLCLLGYTLMLFLMAPYSLLVGLSAHQGSVITAVLNTGQVVGRPLMGMAGDKIGRVNFSIITCSIISIMLFAFWINATTYASLLVLGFMLGMIIGVGSLMAQPITANSINDPKHLPAAWTGVNIIVSIFCLAAEVIALAMRREGAKRPYLHTQIFAGSCFAFCAFLLLLIRERIIQRRIKLSNLSEKLDTRTSQLKKHDTQEDITDQYMPQEVEVNSLRYGDLHESSRQLYFKRMFKCCKI